MKKTIKGFVLGVIITTMLMSTVLGAGIKKTIEVAYNSVNLTVNGKKVNADNILYNGTTYVPLRAAAEALGKEVGWDQGTNTASINDKGAATEPTTPSYSRTNPAPIGVKQTIKVESFSDEYTAEVTITDVMHGDKAWELIQKANMFNKEPEEGKEYLLTKIKVKVIDVKDDKKVDVSPVYFNIYSGNNVEYDSIVFVSEPEPSLRTSLYAGGEHEGYAVYIVNKSDDNPKMVYGQEYDGTGGVWFKLNR